MKIWVTLRIEERYQKIGWEPAYDIIDHKIADVFDNFEKAFAYIESMIERDKQITFNKYENPSIVKKFDDDMKGVQIELVDKGYDSDFSEAYEHSVKWIILEKELA